MNQQPFQAWSPDGRHIAVWGRRGLQIVDAENSALLWLFAEINTSAISWGY